MKLNFSNPLKTGRIPTVLGLVLLLGVVGVTIVASQAAGNLTRFFSSASSTTGINSSVQISNVTDTSFTVSWTTDKESIGRAFVGTTADALTTPHNDVRDTTGTVQNYLTHYVRVNNLLANTQYFVKVGEAGPEFGTDQGEPVTVKTWGPLEARTLDPIFGTVKSESGTGQSGAIVLWEANGAEPLSALTTAEGSYVIPVALARASGGQSWLALSTTTNETLTISSGLLTSTILCTSGLDKPVPGVVMGENKNCQNASETSNDIYPTASKSGQSGFTPPTSGNAFASGSASLAEVEVNIQQGQTVNNPQPTISGKAGPNETINITVHSDTEYSGTVRANPDGTWSWTPPGNLSPGEHTVTIKVAHTDGTVTTETRTFFVSGGNSILPITAGTPSATPKHFACVNNACTQVTGEGSDECSNSNDCTPALPPPVEEPPAPPPVVVPAETPTTGSFENTIIVLTLGLGLLTLGAGVFIKENQR